MFFLWRFPTRFVALHWNKRYVKLPSFFYANKKLSYKSFLDWIRLCIIYRTSLRLDWICKDLQDFASICKVLRGSAIFCMGQPGLQDFARICKILQGSARFCKVLQRSERICKIMQSLQDGISVMFIKNLQFSARTCNTQEESTNCKIQQESAIFLKIFDCTGIESFRCIYFDIFRIIHFVAIPQQTTCQEENPFQLWRTYCKLALRSFYTFYC